MPATAYSILQHSLIAVHGSQGALAKAVGRDFKGIISPLLYLIAIALSVIAPWASQTIYVAVALMWLVPDRRIERRIAHRDCS